MAAGFLLLLPNLKASRCKFNSFVQDSRLLLTNTWRIWQSLRLLTSLTSSVVPVRLTSIPNTYQQNYLLKEHSNMNTTLALLGGTPVITTKEGHYTWPRITPELEASVLKQLHESLSIYDRSGIFARFEQAFADYHGRRYALVENSGTSAIYGMYEGLALQPGDEVLYRHIRFLRQYPLCCTLELFPYSAIATKMATLIQTRLWLILPRVPKRLSSHICGGSLATWTPLCKYVSNMG